MENDSRIKPTEAEAIMAEERSRAHQFWKRLQIEGKFVARLAIKLPEVAKKVTEQVSEKVQETVQEKVGEVQELVASKIKSREQNTSDLDRLPLSDLTTDTGLMKKADLSFDASTATWAAVWNKPALFHFGMILHPELKNQVDPGEKLHFESNGMKLALLRSPDDKLMVEQTNGKQHELSAKRLEGLLQRSISVDGLKLFLDAGGNLVLQAAGDKAKALATKFHLL